MEWRDKAARARLRSSRRRCAHRRHGARVRRVGGHRARVPLARAAHSGAHRRRPLPRGGGVRRQVLATDLTLALLGAAGERLKAHALPRRLRPAVPPRRPSPGDVPLGLHARRASLLCERDGRRIVYAGPIGGGAREVRAADALCIDASSRAPALSFRRAPQALADVGRGRARRARAVASRPVVAHRSARDRAGRRGCARRRSHRPARAPGDRAGGRRLPRRRAAGPGAAEVRGEDRPGRCPALAGAGARAAAARRGRARPAIIVSRRTRRHAVRRRQRRAVRARSCFRPRPTSPASCATSEVERRLRGRPDQSRPATTSGRAARARNRRLHHGPSPADRAFCRRLTPERGLDGRPGDRSLLRFPACSISGWARSPSSCCSPSSSSDRRSCRTWRRGWARMIRQIPEDRPPT